MIGIVVAVNDTASRDRLRAILNQHLGWRVCGEASTGLEAVQLARDLKPQVVVLDLALPAVNGLAAARRIKEVSPETEILALTAHETDDIVRDVLVAGAQACLPWTNAAMHVPAAVDSLAKHRPYLTQRAAQAVLNAFLADEKSAPPSRPFRLLTAREREILQLLAEGRTNAEISRLFGITVKTVETHRAALMKKLDVSSLAELIRYAIRYSVIDDV